MMIVHALLALLIAVVVFAVILMAESRGRVRQQRADEKQFNEAMSGWKKSIAETHHVKDLLEQAIRQLQDARK